HERLTRNLKKWQKTPLKGFAVLGSNGEAVLLQEAEKVAVWQTARAVIDADHIFIAGTGCESTRATLDLTEKAARVGADAAMVVTPHYYRGRMTHEALVHHYTTIADHSPVPVILYNVPASTGVDLHAETIIVLSRHPNIMGLKESSGNVIKIGQVCAAADSDFQVLAGSGSFLLPALSVGAVGGIMALASVAPYQVDEIVQQVKQGAFHKAKEIQLRLIAANAAVTSQFGIPGLKAAMDLIGMYGGPVRAPLLPLTETERETLKKILEEAGIL
ncbi:MAG: dihydrodipicolinate synthase family protein, partial [Deltaproteobacteria bacterium]|nr:dihydrodipicolinate synthase family protein [Deltaproteobacteria bacterium]